ncbi:protein RhiA [Flavivirga eckloniae]|uniref:Protein RhiA n=1 Tax=Flavivirga eckloniae TaxID=1803846 RepID=A0A2K9PT16_9FLAO|nr:protein RhiA [Flavivirga eckloniae]AUP80210.1 protein RhiA [Flavivirga eckloniae]
MILDFSKENAATQYSLKCINNSDSNWYFYIYQRMLNQEDNDVYSLVWMASPYKIGKNSFIIFTWSLEDSFWWFNTGDLQIDVVPASGGDISASLPSNNSTTFSIVDNTPKLSSAVSGTPSDKFLIKGEDNIPNYTFSTGIGMSDFATYLKQSYTNTSQEFDSNTTFWIAATTSQKQVTGVLSQTNISNAAIFSFPVNVYNLTASLGEDNLWTIS